MAKIIMLSNPDGVFSLPAILCPGCGYHHVFDQRWAFNVDMEKPTFSPSMLVNEHIADPPRTHRCHSFVTNGRIQFLSDCTHTLAGQTVNLPDVEE